MNPPSTAAPIDAVYEQGNLRLLHPLPLPEGAQVRLRLELPAGDRTLSALDDLLEACSHLSEEQWQAFEVAAKRREPFFRSGDSE